MTACLSEQLIEASRRVGDTPRQASTDAGQRLLLDAIACAAAATRAPGIEGIIAYARERGPAGESGGSGGSDGLAGGSLLFHAGRVALPEAAMVNAAMVHAWDLDDVLADGCMPVHVTSVIVPTVLACGEAAGSTGRDALAAMAAGIEVIGRLAAVARGRSRGPGLLPTTIFGGFGAAVAAGRLLGLSDEQTVHALGIQYARCSGNRQALLDHTLTKRLQPGFAASSAIESALLARRGITGPRAALEGKAGFFAVYMNGDVPSGEELAGDLGPPFIERVAMKRYPSCGACHHVQLAAERLREQHDWRADRIDRIELINCDPAGIVTGPFVPGDHPSVSAQFSAEWAVAHTLLRGPATLPNYTDAAVAADTDVIALANAIVNRPAPDDLTLPEPGAQGVIVHTTDGRRLVEMQAKSRTFPPGGMSRDETVEKLHACAAFGLADQAPRAQRLPTILDRLEQLDDLQPLLDAVAFPELRHA